MDNNTELLASLAIITQENPQRIIISNPKNGETDYIRVEINCMPDACNITKFTKKQAFHQNISTKKLPSVLAELMQKFSQLNTMGTQVQYRLRITKRGKVQFGKQACHTAQTSHISPSSQPSPVTQMAEETPTRQTEHNRTKNYMIPEGKAVLPLIDMGVLTQDGRVVKAMYHKFRQINRFLEMVDDVVRQNQFSELHVLDFGCGKSYLTFVLYYYLTEIRGIENVYITGLDLKVDVVNKCNQAAKRYNYKNLTFEVGDINGYQSQKPVDMVVTLHACDTATDYALFNAIRWGAKIIFSVPCCQHELNAQMQSNEFSLLTRYGLVQERVCALMTDAIRANLLQVCGYKAQLLEFIEMQHTPKNVLIRAVHAQLTQTQKNKLLQETQRLIQAFGFKPTLYQLLEENHLLPEMSATHTL